jgi:hypothetical protein
VDDVDPTQPQPGLTGQLARVVGDLDRVATDGLRPAAMAVGVLFTVFTVYNWLAYPPDVRIPVVLYDLGLVVLGFGLYAVCRRRTLSSNGIHLGAAALSFGVLGQILLGTLLGVNPMFSFFVSILLIASAGSVLSVAWAVAIAAVEVAAWALVARVVLSAAELEQNWFVVMTSAGVAFIVHVGRYRARADPRAPQR